MNQEDIKALKSHHRSLKGQQEILDQLASRGIIVLDKSTYRIIADEIRRVKAHCPNLLPPFDDSDFLRGAHDGESPYWLAPFRTYLATAIAKIEAEIEELPAVDIPSMALTREGVFFAGQYFDAFRQVAEILSRAQASIVIIDGYIDEALLARLTSKSPNVTVSILTKNVLPSFTAAATAFNKQYGGLVIRSSSAFHDRFIIIDGIDYYHLGASLKDLGHRGFMFSRIEEELSRSLLNLAERDGRASYPQFTARRRVPR